MERRGVLGGAWQWRLGLLGREAVIITDFRVCFSIEQKELFQNAVSSWRFCPNPLEMCVPSGEAGTRAAAPRGSGRHTAGVSGRAFSIGPPGG